MAHLTAKCCGVVVLCMVVATLAGCASHKKDAQAEEETLVVKPLPGKQLNAEEQRKFNMLFLEAVRQKEKEKYDAEFELLNAALQLNPDAPEALFEMAQLKLTFGSMVDTLSRVEGDSLLRRAIALAPQNIDLKETLANQLAREGKYKEAIKLYKEMIGKRPDVDRLTVLVGLQEESADFEGAIESITRLEQIEGKSERLSIEKFRLYNELGDNEHAYASIEALCEQFPHDLRYRVLLGDLYMQNGYHEMAQAIYKDVLTLEPDNSYAQISLLAYYKKMNKDSLYRCMVEDVVLNPETKSEAKVEAMRGFVGEAMQTQQDSTEVLSLFRRALRQPQDDRALAELCAYYMVAVGMPSTSLKPVMEKILTIEPDYNRARLQLLDIFLRERNMKEVAELCRSGNDYSPSEVIYYYYGGLAELQLNHNATARQILLKGTQQITPETDTQTASELWAALGDVSHEMNDKQASYEAYEQALSFNPNNLMCLNNYAYFLSLDGQRLDYAAAMSRRTINAEPTNATFLDTYAWILFLQKQYTQAHIYISQALEHLDETEENASIYDHAGDISFRMKRTREALRFWIKALGSVTDTKERAKIKRKVERRRL